jgi:hypothetical protein
MLAAADFNKDGNLDLAAISTSENYIAVLSGNPDGTFKGSSLYGTGPCPLSFSVADFNRDGNLDLAVPDSCDSNFVELQGDGMGKFMTRRDFGITLFSKPVSLAAGYLDADQNLDLAVLLDSMELVLMPGNKNGAFRVGTTYNLSSAAKWVTVADVNGDHKTDVITADGNNATVSVYLGNGNGTLQAATSYATDSKKPVFVAAVDVNADGKLDLVTANKLGSFSVLIASGSGYLPHVDYPTTSPVQLAFGDFNRDGNVDLVTVNNTGNSHVFLGNGDGTFSTGVALTLSGAPISAATGDVNNDGRLDIVVANSSGTSIYTFLGNGDGTFQTSTASAVPKGANQVLLADFDGDGKLDALLAEGTKAANGMAALLPGKGDGTFRQAQLYTLDDAGMAEAIGDFNSDGALDVATANGFAASVSVLLNTAAK